MVRELGRWVPHDVHYAGFAPCDVALFGFCRRALRQLVHECPIGQLVCWKHRMDTAYLPKLPLEEPDEPIKLDTTLEPILDPIHHQRALLPPLRPALVSLPSCRGVPASFEDGHHVIWLLHLFSGRRRVGDCHWWLEHLAHL